MMLPMTRRIGSPLQATTSAVRRLVALVAVLLLAGLGLGAGSVVAGGSPAVATSIGLTGSVGSVGSAAAVSLPSSSSPTVSSSRASTPAPGLAERRQAPAKVVAGARSAASWASVQPEPVADVPVGGWLPPPGRVAGVVAASPEVIALTIRVSHSGRAPPAGVLPV
jgi:hypothetical protein